MKKTSTMKPRSRNSCRNCKEEESVKINLLRSINNQLLMSGRSGYGSFQRVSLRGENVGAAMTVRNGPDSGESLLNCCNINVYVNNNVQGVNNSVLVGSEVKVIDSGVALSMRDVLGFPESKRTRTRTASDVGFVGLILAVVILVFSFLWFVK